MSQFVVSARKYRPQRFDEVVGQQHVTKTIKNAIERDHLAHALLFCGPRGVGKTTCARILAKRLNCLNPTEDNEPCNTCESCVNMLQNASFNIIEQDAASNNSVDQIRSLIDLVRIPPQNGNYKIFIIDEVHMLSPSAFNAFLKTLEEPPPHAIFILATTEKHKILPTILSRCQIYDFKRVRIPQIVSHLNYVAEQENIQTEHDALHTIATKADGALRDALSIFDRVVSSTSGKLEYTDVVTQLNLLDYEVFFDVTDSLIAGDISSILLKFDEVLKNGFEGDLFITGLAKHLRDLLVCQFSKTIELLEVSENLKKRYYEQAKLVRRDFLLTALQQLNECDIHYQRAQDKRLHVEMALARITYAFQEIPTSFIKGGDKKKRRLEASSKPVETGKSTSNIENSDQKDTIQASSIDKNQSTDQLPSSQSTKNVAVKNSEEARGDSELKSEEKEPSQSENQVNSVVSEESERKLSSFKKGKASITSSLPQLGNLTELVKQVDQIEDEIREKKPPITQENLENFLAHFQKISTSPSISNAINKSIIELKENNIQLLVANHIDKSILSKESNIQDELRSYFYDNSLKIKIYEDEKLKKEKIKDKPKSNREILEELKNQNESVKNIIEVLNLKLKE